MEIKAAGVGFCCADVYEKLGCFYPTGNGVDWGIHLSRMGIDVSIVSVVGTDSYGERMKQELEKEKINVAHLRTEPGDTCKMMMDLKNGTDRVHLEEIEGVMESYQLTAEEIEFVKSNDYMHTDLFGRVLEHLEEFHRAGVKIVMDFSIFSQDPEYNCERLFPYVDYVFFSCDNTEEEPLIAWIKKIHSYGPKIVTATRGEKGSISYDGEKVYRFGIFPANVVNTVGAGDSYIAGFTYGIMTGRDLPACMEMGARLSSEVITRFEPY
ncbi:fructoselysine 6-kinase [Ruminiclostridium sufflavum DSM 19573]|uniref:Fructoselysine 6-kinase n=1 Tax=Ruminiclostridium sufflavum DSM 19573 TaxID=1121337 RepID=A0A318XUA3_9FIRM|nr:fructoselysine 6-kinase [Ruminiclostridium sufflavum]PYG85922.1 fructoselysine 6-kinase [Ruminiclostridium sufflavum DSM 19573]